MKKSRIGRFEVCEGDGFPSVDVFSGGQRLGVVNCLAVEDRVGARQREAGDETLRVTEGDIEWALENALIRKEA